VPERWLAAPGADAASQCSAVGPNSRADNTDLALPHKRTFLAGFPMSPFFCFVTIYKHTFDGPKACLFLTNISFIYTAPSYRWTCLFVVAFVMSNDAQATTSGIVIIVTLLYTLTGQRDNRLISSMRKRRSPPTTIASSFLVRQSTTALP
jgi:hypothetical protein